MHNGWVKFARNLLDWEWYDDANMVRLLLHLYLKANFAAQQWRGVEIGRGSLVTSLTRLAAETGLSVMTVRTCLRRMRLDGTITQCVVYQRTVITLCGYDGCEAIEHAANTAANSQSTRIYKNKENKENYSQGNSKRKGNERFPAPSVEEVEAEVIKHGYAVDAENFVSYYTGIGWRVGRHAMRDWRAALRTWHRREIAQLSGKHTVNQSYNLKTTNTHNYETPTTPGHAACRRGPTDEEFARHIADLLSRPDDDDAAILERLCGATPPDL